MLKTVLKRLHHELENRGTGNAHALLADRIQKRSSMHVESFRSVVKRQQSGAHMKLVKKLKRQARVKLKAKRSECLRKIRAFKDLKLASLNHIVDAMTDSHPKPGSVICREGEPADKFYVLVSGQCAVKVGEEHVATMGDLEFFGESALFINPVTKLARARTATVTAQATVGSEDGPELLEISKRDFDTLIKSGKIDAECTQRMVQLGVYFLWLHKAQANGMTRRLAAPLKLAADSSDNTVVEAKSDAMEEEEDK
jgi:hypothetical protein